MTRDRLEAGVAQLIRLKAANGETIAASQGYITKTNALDGIESVRKNAADAPIVDVAE